jgi:hypothetical protein
MPRSPAASAGSRPTVERSRSVRTASGSLRCAGRASGWRCSTGTGRRSSRCSVGISAHRISSSGCARRWASSGARRRFCCASATAEGSLTRCSTRATSRAPGAPRARTPTGTRVVAAPAPCRSPRGKATGSSTALVHARRGRAAARGRPPVLRPGHPSAQARPSRRRGGRPERVVRDPPGGSSRTSSPPPDAHRDARQGLA